MLFHSDLLFFFKQKTAYEMRISDWSSDVCSSDLPGELFFGPILHHGIRHMPFAGHAGMIAGFPKYFGQRHRTLQQVPAVSLAVFVGSHVTDEIGRAACRERVCRYV